MAKVIAIGVGCVIAFGVWAMSRPNTNGPDPYQSFRLGDDQAGVIDRAKHAYGEVTDTSGAPGEEFCYEWALPYTKLCFVNGMLFDKSR